MIVSTAPRGRFSCCWLPTHSSKVLGYKWKWELYPRLIYQLCVDRAADRKLTIHERMLIKASGRVAGTIRAQTFFSSLLSRIHRLLQAVMKPPCPGSARRRCKPPSRRQIRSASYAALPGPLRSNYGDPFPLPSPFPPKLPASQQLFPTPP